MTLAVVMPKPRHFTAWYRPDTMPGLPKLCDDLHALPKLIGVMHGMHPCIALRQLTYGLRAHCEFLLRNPHTLLSCKFCYS